MGLAKDAMRFMITPMALPENMILLIGGSESSTGSLQELPAEAGYDVLVVPTEAVALDALQQVSPSLVVTIGAFRMKRCGAINPSQ
ncbi:MAG TPA: hypothetical protein VKP13_08740 [Nitrospira sp.]|nr:hypothetical protein [Nitrospira sp.]